MERVRQSFGLGRDDVQARENAAPCARNLGWWLLEEAEAASIPRMAHWGAFWVTAELLAGILEEGQGRPKQDEIHIHLAYGDNARRRHPLACRHWAKLEVSGRFPLLLRAHACRAQYARVDWETDACVLVSVLHVFVAQEVILHGLLMTQEQLMSRVLEGKTSNSHLRALVMQRIPFLRRGRDLTLVEPREGVDDLDQDLCRVLDAKVSLSKKANLVMGEAIASYPRASYEAGAGRNHSYRGGTTHANAASICPLRIQPFSHSSPAMMTDDGCCGDRGDNDTDALTLGSGDDGFAFVFWLVCSLLFPLWWLGFELSQPPFVRLEFSPPQLMPAD